MPKSRRIAAQLIRRRWTAGEAITVLSALRASGLSTSAFATREGLGVERLYRWRQRLGAKSVAARKTSAFVELAPRATERVEIVLRTGRVLRVAETIDTGTLERLVEALERPGSC